MSTAPADFEPQRLRRARFGRRVFFAGLTAFLVLGLLGVYGVRTSDARGAGEGYELTVHYARVSRGGLATPWSVEVRHPGGFPSETVTLATDASYFDLFDENGLDPDPQESFADADQIVWTFAVPQGSDILNVSFDARIEPGAQLVRASATTSVLEEGLAVASVSYRTFVMP